MMNTKGIALVSALLISAVILMFGLGSIYLSNMNEGIADGQRSAAIARSNAEAGLQVARLTLSQAYAGSTPKQLPASLTLPTSPHTAISYTLVSYTPVTTGGLRTQAQVVVEGTGPRSGRYRAEALVGTATSSTSSFPLGLVSENVVQVNGDVGYSGVSFKNAMVHGNKGFDLRGNGSYQNCDASGITCTNLTGASRPISAGTAMSPYTCQPSGGGSEHSSGSLCSGSTPLAGFLKAPITVGTPPYTTTRDTVFNSGSTVPGSASNPPCNVISGTLGATYTAGQTVCVTAGVSLSSSENRSYSDLNLIIYGNVLFEGDMTFSNANLLITGTLHTKGNVTLSNSRIFSNGSALTEGNVFSSGSSTLASGDTLTVKGNVEHTNPGSDVGLLMMSVGAFSVPGNMEKGGGGGQLLHGLVWSGGTADVSGNVALRGGIASVGKLTVTGNATVDGRASLINSDLPSDSQLAVQSRR